MCYFLVISVHIWNTDIKKKTFEDENLTSVRCERQKICYSPLVASMTLEMNKNYKSCGDL